MLQRMTLCVGLGGSYHTLDCVAPNGPNPLGEAPVSTFSLALTVPSPKTALLVPALGWGGGGGDYPLYRFYCQNGHHASPTVRNSEPQ